MSDRQADRLFEKPRIQRHKRPSSAKSKTCSDRIIQLALPNLHIVSSVLKEHFRTLSRDHVDRLEKLMDHIKTTKVTISQMNFIEDLKDFQESDKRRIMQILDGVHAKKSTPETGTEWKKVKLLPVKSSSDTFLIELNKRQTYFSFHSKSDKSSTDSSSNIGSTYKGVFKKAVESMNWNYRETVFIKLEGVQKDTKSQVEQNSKYVQTEEHKPEVSEPCNQDIRVLYVQTKNSIKKKTKLRQLHTLPEKSEFLKNNLDNTCNTINSENRNQATNCNLSKEAIKCDKSIETVKCDKSKEAIKCDKPKEAVKCDISTEIIRCDKSSQAFEEDIQLSDDVKIMIIHVYKFYILMIRSFNFFLNTSSMLLRFLQEYYYKSLPFIVKATNSFFDIYSNFRITINRAFNEICYKIFELRNPRYYDEEYLSELQLEHRKKKRKRKLYYTKGYHLSNIVSILH